MKIFVDYSEVNKPYLGARTMSTTYGAVWIAVKYKTNHCIAFIVVDKLLVSILVYTTIMDSGHPTASKGTREATSWPMAVLINQYALADGRKQNTKQQTGAAAQYQARDVPSEAHLSKMLLSPPFGKRRF